MSDDQKFEDELRSALDRLALEPAPERLVARVAQIPSRKTEGSTSMIKMRLSPKGLGSGAGLLAAAAAVILAVMIVRPGAGPIPVGASPSQSSPAQVSATPANPSTAVATPTTAPTSGPSPSLVRVPPDFLPLSATFVSAQEGWVLGSAPCGGARCPSIARTLNGGATWSSISAPSTTIANNVGSQLPGGSGISSLRFADPMNGWAFGPELWATHDGGTTWSRVSIGGVTEGPTVLALETAAGRVHAILVNNTSGDFPIASSRVASDDWQIAGTSVPVGAGPVPRLQIVLAGASGWVLENDRVVTAGATLVSGAWKAWQPPCLDVTGPAALAASSASDLVAACDVGQWSSPHGEHLYASADGGTTFAQTGTRTPLNGATAVTSPIRSTVIIAGSDAGGAALVASFDGGRTWSKALTAGNGSFRDLGFTTPTQGIVIATDGAGASRLLMTHDAGRTWAPVGF